jgi:multisubunit Na+/H+ antiporter MnhB subunit
VNPPRSSEGMSLIVQTVCHWLKGFILLYGIQIILYGHLTPGGGFAGGVIVACAFVLIMLAEGERQGVQTFPPQVASTWDSVGVLVFLGMAGLGLVLAGTFFVNFWTTPESARFTLFSSGIIPVCNMGIGLKVGSSLYLICLVLTVLHRALRPGKKGEQP